jgi:hypothetical protein
MNSGRPPQNGNLCLGVWEKTGRSRFKLNHFANGNVIDLTNPTAIGSPGGPTQVVEHVILSRDGNRYAGTFTLDAYDTPSNGNKLLAHIIGVVTATRITVHTGDKRILGNGGTRTARPVTFCRVVGRKACPSARTENRSLHISTYP